MRDIDKLRACYDELHALLGDNAEPWESVELVEEYRRYWRPDNVRIILLAESHVHTTDEDSEFKLSPRKDLPNYPRDYTRFVYCLAYGENSLLENGCPKNNRGTWQFWKLFHSCINGNADCAPILKKGTPNNEKRIQNKINLLYSLKELGIWLVDTSIIALYNKGKKPKKLIMTEALQTSWDKYTGQIVKEANPDFVIVIGKGVKEALQGRLPDNIDEITQPNAFLSAKEHLENWQKCYELCQKHAPQK